MTDLGWIIALIASNGITLWVVSYVCDQRIIRLRVKHTDEIARLLDDQWSQ
jgi:hypothetical protein